MLKRKQSEGFNLAFLDIMSCGLGAVVLVFMLVKHNVAESSSETEQLRQNIEQLERTRQQSEQTLQRIETELQDKKAITADVLQQLSEARAALSQQSADVAKTSAQLEKLKTDISSIKVNKRQDIIETPGQYEENYLLGLKVTGSKIAILFDSSASMTNEKLIDIIKTKSGSARDKQEAEKWVRAKRTLEWLLIRLPANSEVMVVTYNETARLMGKAAWIQARDEAGIQSILSDMNNIIPTGPTNLQLGLNEANQYSPSNLYVITDGLPTKGESRYKSLNPFASCGSLLGRSNTISGACRVRLFRQTLTESANKGLRVDVVLLPIEGDPDAINEYWSWTAVTGGLLISPAGNWP